jgi:predicted aspartyl protease
VILGAALVLASLGQMDDGHRCVVPVLYRGADGFRIEMVAVAAGGDRTLGVTDELVTPILPVGGGTSGDLVRAGDRATVTLRCNEATVAATVTPTAGGAPRDLAPVALANYDRYDLRVNALDHRGNGQVFWVRGGRISAADGPVMDLFRGAIPMQPGDVSVTLEVRVPEERAAPDVVGSIELTDLGPFAATWVTLPGGERGKFIVDLGAGRTVVSRRLLASDAATRDLVAVEHSAEGQRRRQGSVQGAGGAVTAVRQLVDLPWIRLGDLRVDDVSALVLDSAPFTIDGQQLDGVLGLDVLRRAGRVRGSFGRPDGTAVLHLGGPSLPSSLEFPLQRVGGVLWVQGAVDGMPLPLLLDTGARQSIVPLTLAGDRGWPVAAEPSDSGRGLDGRWLAFYEAELPSVSIGDWEMPVTPFMASERSVPGALGMRNDALILGQPFWRAIGEVEVDFERDVLKIPWPR